MMNCICARGQQNAICANAHVVDGARLDFSLELIWRFAEGAQDAICLDWATYASNALDTMAHGIVIPLSNIELDADMHSSVVRNCVQAIANALVKRWGLERMFVEFDKPQTTQVFNGSNLRTLLPHHDGGNSSFLTPSRCELASWSPSDRRTFPNVISTTRTHKLYQGFVVRAAGQGHSLTPYYDVVSLLKLAFEHRTGREPPSLHALVEFCAGNLRHSLSVIRQAGGGYVQLGALLGITDPRQVLVNLHNIDAPLSDEERAFFSGDFRAGQPEALSVFDAIVVEATGIRWQSLRERTEHCLKSDEKDIVLGHNITLMHGGLCGGEERVLDPVCFVMADAEGEAYEHWLSAAWMAAFARA
ncbi:hypothetical protein CN172_20435 [Sinorhizobium meliloti]|uniref:hypothetical protein n=1 Tax=Rhizobium meliloti TaxID=382 RepID=UPI000FDB25C8|nr:hypothetical protein [Sinorhizobium meliloti]RVE96415.1 hypothetical protein CN232_24105 [Sinorhizobium meliloti]RVH47472.1 hypothetical protein CN208_04660 [Sinorhizobium meliloti]RVK11110.1 hypothetical protein CN172_20435 [Sinorhizobium meliloti]